MNIKYDNDNVFAKILRGEIPCEKVYEDENVLAFNDLHPAAPVHILVIPKKQVICFDDFITKSTKEEIANFFITAQKIANSLSLPSYKIVANCGIEAGQIIFHYHLHILGYK